MQDHIFIAIGFATALPRDRLSLQTRPNVKDLAQKDPLSSLFGSTDVQLCNCDQALRKWVYYHRKSTTQFGTLSWHRIGLRAFGMID